MTSRWLPGLILIIAALAGCLGTPSLPTGPEASPGAAPETEVAVDTPTVSNVTDTSATVRTRVAGPATVRTRVVWGPVESDWPTANTTLRTGPGTHAVTLTGLAPDTTYRLVGEARLGDRPAARSLPARFTTDADPERSDARDAGSGWASGEAIRIQPGTPFFVRGGICTLGYILTTPVNGSVYAAIPGHCAQDGNDEEDYGRFRPENLSVRLRPSGEPFGQVVFYAHDTDAGHNVITLFGGLWVDPYPAPNRTVESYDWGLVRIHDGWIRTVSPAIRYWGGPTGLGHLGDVRRGEPVCFTGAGIPDYPEGVLSPRCGAFAGYREAGQDVRVGSFGAGYAGPLDWWGMHGPAKGGDSGSPLFAYETGKAIGLFTYNDPFFPADGWAMGPTLESILERAADLGWDLELATAPYDPSPLPADP